MCRVAVTCTNTCGYLFCTQGLITDLFGVGVYQCRLRAVLRSSHFSKPWYHTRWCVLAALVLHRLLYDYTMLCYCQSQLTSRKCLQLKRESSRLSKKSFSHPRTMLQFCMVCTHGFPPKLWIFRQSTSIAYVTTLQKFIRHIDAPHACYVAKELAWLYQTHHFQPLFAFFSHKLA